MLSSQNYITQFNKNNSIKRVYEKVNIPVNYLNYLACLTELYMRVRLAY